MIAVKAILLQEAVFWPDGMGKIINCKQIQEKFDSPHCVGFWDRTLLTLAYKPSPFGED
jgi:hypothetical protein